MKTVKIDIDTVERIEWYVDRDHPFNEVLKEMVRFADKQGFSMDD